MMKIVTYWIITANIIAVLLGRNSAHEIISLVVPAIADPREKAILSCRYDMGKDQLYSTKWYKHDQELFRYMPAQKPPGLEFPVTGISMAQPPKCSKIACDLELTNLTANSAGLYRCEVSSEAPTFKIVHQSANMTVAALPRIDPLVEGAATSYALGDDIRVNCTSDPSLPPADVTWYINDEKATFPYLDGSSESAPDVNGLSTRSLALRLKADRSLFLHKTATSSGSSNNGTLVLRCVSAMPSWLPGGVYKRQFTITSTLRIPTKTDNLKLKWHSAGVIASGCPGLLLMVPSLMFLSAAVQRGPQAVY